MRFLILIACICLLSCGPGKNETQASLAGTDSLVINFNRPGSDSIDRTVNTTERKAIEELVGFLKGQKKAPSKCSLDGDLQFYENGTLIGNIVFSCSVDSCRQFILVEKDGSFNSLPMSHKASDFLKSLQEGKSWY